MIAEIDVRERPPRKQCTKVKTYKMGENTEEHKKKKNTRSSTFKH